MELSRTPTSIIRMLVSEREPGFTDLITRLTHDVARIPISIATIMPPSVQEHDLLETAASQKFDFAVLFLNNILYSSDDRRRLADDSILLVQKMRTLFGKPIIGVSGHPNSEEYRSRVLAAGATVALGMPWDNSDMQQAIKKCTNIW